MELVGKQLTVDSGHGYTSICQEMSV